MATPTPLDPTTSKADLPINPAASFWEASGGCDASAVSGVVQDWYIHTQGYYVLYDRKQVWRDTNVRKSVSPSVEYNYVDANVTVWANDEILRNAQFSSCMTSLQQLNLMASGSCSTEGLDSNFSGWGDNGILTTSAEGVVLRPARKDGAGNILDPTGQERENFSITLNKNPDPYSCSSGWDTLTAVKADIAELNIVCKNHIDSFIPSLVRI